MHCNCKMIHQLGLLIAFVIYFVNGMNIVEWIDDDLTELRINPDPDVNDDVPTLIHRHGYPIEIHPVITEDGYILQLFRIPHGKHELRSDKFRQPVLLQHGLLADSSCWVLMKEQSLAFLLADIGYDVWLGNLRGTHYGSNHTKYTPKQFEFWDFSWDEMADHDLPTFFKYINLKTDQQIFYIGHSMGTTTFFACMASHPEYSKYIKGMFALAPVAYMSQMRGALAILSPIADDFEIVMRLLGVGEFILSDRLIQLIFKAGCCLETAVKYVCENILFAFMGFDEYQIDIESLSSILSHMPSTSSVRTVVHYAQEKIPDTFQRYNFGKVENLKRYGVPFPPIFNTSKINVPITLYWGPNDWLSNKLDVDRLWLELPNKVHFRTIPWKHFNHIDFLFAKDVKVLVYDQLIYDMKHFPLSVSNLKLGF